ncbi:MAG: hypothetical protein V4438_01645 [Patescibacteria group bacterium]
MDWKNLDKTKTVRITLICIAGIIVVVTAFQAGMIVGYKKASFFFHDGDNYYRAMSGEHHASMMGIPNDDLPGSFGASGKILKVSLPTIVIEDRDNVEKTVLITDDTIIRMFRGDASTSDIKADDFAIVVGSPNSRSEIEAKLLRILPAPATSTPN